MNSSYVFLWSVLFACLVVGGNILYGKYNYWQQEQGNARTISSNYVVNRLGVAKSEQTIPITTAEDFKILADKPEKADALRLKLLNEASPITVDGRLILTSLQGMYDYVRACHDVSIPVSVLSFIHHDVFLNTSCNVSHHHIRIFDEPAENLLAYFEQGTRFIYDQLDLDGSKRHVVVHCHAGISRSATMVIAFLMRYYDMTLSEARVHVHKSREIIQPNAGFVTQLERWESMLREGKIEIMHGPSIND